MILVWLSMISQVLRNGNKIFGLFQFIYLFLL
jgi:urea transporter